MPPNRLIRQIPDSAGESHSYHTGSSPTAGKPPTAKPRPESTAQSTNSDAGISLTKQAPADTVALIDADGRTPTDLWHGLAAGDKFQAAFVGAVLDAGDGRTATEFMDALDAADVDALHGAYRSLLVRTAAGDERAMWDLLRETRHLGTGRSAFDDVLGAARVFALADRTPTVAVKIGRAFRDRRAEQRREACDLLATLARGCDVRVVAGPIEQRWLVDAHRADLPVSFESVAPRDSGPLGDVVDAAQQALDPDSREVRILRELADEPSGVLSRHQLRSMHEVSRGRLSQVLVSDDDSLTDLGLVDEFGPDGDRKVELLEAGREYLSALSEQITLSDAVSEPPHSHSQGRVTTRSGGGQGDAGPYRTAYMNRPHHTATVACGDTAGDVSMVKHPVETGESRRVRLVSYDGDRDEAVVSVRATGALMYTVSAATALASPEFVDRALPVSRLEAIEDPPAILRDARCIGGLSDDALDDGQELRDTLVEWGREIEDLTTDLHRGEYDDRDSLRSAIMRSAHGLAGSLVHLLDAVGVDVTREVRVPGGLSCDHLDELAESVGISAAIQSKYGAFAAYRQLFEDRSHKRDTALSPEVDATDPTGTLIGSFVVRGPDVHRIREPIEDHVGTPRAVVDDAPEFAVPVTVRDAGREAYATVATRLLGGKDLHPTRDAVTVLHALSGSPLDAARAVAQLSPEDRERDVRLDEVRYALATLPGDRILPDLPPSVGAIVAALLRADERLSQATLADRADVSTESIRRHRDRLADLGLLDRTDAGYRLALSFPTTDERQSPVAPDTPGRFVDAVDALLLTTLPAERYADPSDPLGGALYHPPNPWGVADDPDLNPWVTLAGALFGADPPARETTVSVGPEVEQTPLTAASESSGGVA